ncbi:hypothetical protein MMIC_P2288 [Mariprofundus micogutta]|uniref:PilZ domain-containing protein n=1 Tax=Mariprofundus micogutta TaxID=1921010 RepID=A0A1L8CQW1_9PROT|nr:PilZ domain-containing protein [Mariprofundus micogutta]GAV21305.1 hypothetical protein MMIC_P2288 [Mariprofundus micogutta]
MKENKRKAERRPYHDQGGVDLHHIASNLNYRAKHVYDVSTLGIGLNVNVWLDPGECIRLTLNQGDCHIQLHGQVAWCKQSGDTIEGFDMGIVLQ